MMNTNKLKLLAIPLLITLSISTIAAGNYGKKSNKGARRGAPPFCVMDINADGSITEAEYNEFISMRAEMAANKNGRRGSPPFCKFDLDKDGSITLDEFSQNNFRRGDPETIFNTIDTDSNGFISEEELANHKPVRRNNKRGR